MTHRVEQIVDALVALMPSTSANYKHRVLSLSGDEGELPARSVNLGSDEPLDDDGGSNLAFLDSLATIEIAHKIEGTDEQDVLETLLDMRRDTDVAVMADRSLGLSFVIDTRYAGAEAPERDVVNERIAGVYVTRWLVHYRMNVTDPS